MRESHQYIYITYALHSCILPRRACVSGGSCLLSPSQAETPERRLEFLRTIDLSSGSNLFLKKRKKKRRHVINVAVSWLSTSAAPFILTMIIWRCLFVGPEVYYLQPGHQTLIWREILNNLNIVPVYNPIERLILHLFTAFHFKVWTWIYERLLWFVAKWQKRCHHLLTKTETRQLYLPGKRESRRRMNQENPFIGVSIQGATTTAQVSSSPVERPPYFSLASRSAIDCCEDPLGAAGLIDSGAARHRSSSLLYPPRVQDRPIHPCPISEPYPFFLSDPGDEYTHWFLPLWRL